MYSYAPKANFGFNVRADLKKDNSWHTDDDLNYYKNLTFHTCTTGDKALFYETNQNYDWTIG